VSVEDVIAEADVSRATFYGLFSSKYGLLEGILNPLFELATRRIQELAATLPADDMSMAATRLRGFVLGHREWVAANRLRAGVSQRWREFFREWDVVVCPNMPTPAFPHDHTPESTRRIAIDDRDYAYGDQVVWAGVATLPGLPATAMPVEHTETGLPIGLQVVGPYLEDRTTLAFARLVEREFGGFVPPPALGG